MRFNFVYVNVQESVASVTKVSGDRMQISLFLWGYFKFNHRWGLGQKVFPPALYLLSLFPIVLSSPLQEVSAQVASGSGDTRGGRFSTSKQTNKKRQKALFILHFLPTDYKKSCSLSYKLWCIFRSMVNTWGSKSLPEKQIKIGRC